jgi:hypothetical protein
MNRINARQIVATAAIGWLLHVIILSLVVNFGDNSSYYGFGTKWKLNNIIIVMLSICTLPTIPYLIKPNHKTRKGLWITAIAHLPFIHYGILFTIMYFVYIGRANEKTQTEIKNDLLRRIPENINKQTKAQQVDTRDRPPHQT